MSDSIMKSINASRYRAPLRNNNFHGGSARNINDKQRQISTRVFTGIVQGKAKVADIDKKTDFSSVQIEFPTGATTGVKLGASVAINGTCLTVTDIQDTKLHFDIISETLRRTNLGVLEVGSSVNFERSAVIGDEIGGHSVSGHVHSTAEITLVDETEDNRRLQFRVNETSWMKYIMPKGYIGVDGCSLTVGEVGDDWFSVYLIPETLRVTVLGEKGKGDTVNVEIEAQTQAIVDTVERVVQQYMADRR